MKSRQEKTEFLGEVKFVSSSLSGEADGVVLNDGSFIKLPLHHYRHAQPIKVGAFVSGKGEVVSTSPNRVFDRVEFQGDVNVISDESIRGDLTLAPNEETETALALAACSSPVHVVIRGDVVAMVTKSKGLVDRMIFNDGTSVHVPDGLDFSSYDVEIGDSFEIEGEQRTYDHRHFVRAERIQAR